MDTNCLGRRLKKAASLIVLMLFAPHLHGAQAADPEHRYRELCANCHSADFSNAFENGRWIRGGTDEDVARVIREGLPKQGMPAFGNVLSDGDIRTLVTYVRDRVAARSASRVGSMVGRTIEAESLRRDRSGGYALVTSETNPDLQYVGYFDIGSHICYDDIDLAGVRSIDFRYAKGEGEPPRRFAILVYDESGQGARANLGEKITTLTGDWETFRTLRVGLSAEVSGPRRLCIVGMEGGGVFNLDKFTLSDQPGANDGVTQSFSVSQDVISAGGHDFVLEKVAEAPAELWAMDFLPDDRIVATQKSGSVWLFKNGERFGPVSGTPKVWFRGQGGLLAVKAHPDYASNGWLYLTYADPTSSGAMTRIVRGRLRDLQWVDEETIYRAPATFYTDAGMHFGARLIFHGEYLYFSIGDRGQQERAQDLNYPYGKIHRLFADGKIPEDNPFAAQKTALASVFSYGHRNPQGLAVHPLTGELWSAEHGPRGGDELNLVREGLNYGWPVVTFGINYDGTPISDATHKEGMEPPRHHWTPSIAASAIRFYTGVPFANWRNQLLVGSLGRQELHLVRIESGAVTKDEVLLQGMGRIRDISIGPDSYPYVVLNHPTGMIYRLVPANSAMSRR